MRSLVPSLLILGAMALLTVQILMQRSWWVCGAVNLILAAELIRDFRTTPLQRRTN